MEYINGIPVIKAFGKSGASYERFAIAAKDEVSCFVEWMRRCNIPFSIAMILAPFTVITVILFGGLLVMNGSFAATDCHCPFYAKKCTDCSS